MVGDNGKYFESIQAKLVSAGGWLLTEQNQLVNLEKIDCAEIQSLHYGDPDQKVALYPSGEAEPFVACIGSLDKCKEYLKLLADYLGAKRIVVYESHPCECWCGCQTQLNEGYTICEDCEGIHSIRN